MILKYKKLRANAVEPRRAHPDDAGLDLAPTEFCNIAPGRTMKLPTGIAIELPPGHVGLLVPRSSTRARGLDMTGVIDPSYQGELFMCVTNIGDSWQDIEREQFLGQLLIVPVVAPAVELTEAFERSSDRGTGGFGSSDKRPAGNGG